MYNHEQILELYQVLNWSVAQSKVHLIHNIFINVQILLFEDLSLQTGSLSFVSVSTKYNYSVYENSLNYSFMNFK